MENGEKKNLNLVVDIKDLYVDYEESGVQDAIFEQVEQSLTRELVSKFSDDARKQLADKVIKSIDEEYSELIKKRIIKNINTDNIQIKGRYGGDTKKLQDYISEKFSELITEDKVDEIMQRQVDNMWEKLKERYDKNFATQIIAKLKEAEMLTDDASKFLLEK